MRVRFTRTAQRDLAQIHAFIGQDSPITASRFVAQLVQHARKIGDHPLAGRATDEADVRVMTAPRLRYLIFYTVVADEVHITHIRHTSRRRPNNWGR